MTNQHKSYLYIALSILLWSSVASAFKLSLREMNHLHLLFFASNASVTALFIVLLMSGKIKLLKQQSSANIVKSAVLGFLNPFLYYMVLFKAYSLLPAQEAQPLNWTWPITLTILSSLFLKQKIVSRHICIDAYNMLVIV
ncbi:DMT family transporter [bacterium]|nr:DMT family transporter [bacterium]